MKELLSQTIADQLLDRLDYIRITPQSIGVVGGDISLVEKIQKRYAEATVYHNPLETFSVDLLILFEPIPSQSLFYDCWRALKDDGLLLFMSLGPDTFRELYHSLKVKTPFLDMHYLGDWLKQLHFSDPVVDRDEFTLAYEKPQEVIADFSENEIKQFFSCEVLNGTELDYEQYKTEEYYPLTLEVIYGHAWKVRLPESTEETNEVCIPLDQILKQR